MIKKTIGVFVGILILVSLVSAMQITYFYSDSCPHCQRIKPTIFGLAQQSYKGHWNLYETSYPENQEAFVSHGFKGVPAFIIETDDGREIKFTGANLPKLNCELNEMSTKECQTYSADNCIGGSWFID